MANTKRVGEENKEALEKVTNEAPESKFQGSQQIANSTGFKVDSGKSSFVPEKKKAPGSTLKQEVAASVVKDASYGGSLSGDGMSFAGTRSSGSVGGILGAANATPVAGKARSDSRTSKKLDRNSTKLNFIPSDQVLVEWDESKPLAESSDLDQGFNGTYRNEFARTQKNQESVPGALMFDRSLDLLVKDNLYFGQGQKIKQTGVTLDEDVTVTATPDTNGVYQYPSSANYIGGTTGNYLNGSVDILFSNTGEPAYMVYNDVDLDATVDEYDANKSSAQNKILMNDAELVRETMDTKAGDEKADIWSCLPRGIMQPTQMLAFLRDLEASVGNEVLTAYRKASTSLSFQLNRAHKDGQDTKAPGILALLGLNYNYISDDAAASDLGTEISGAFNRAYYLGGAASTMIPLYDSTGKYNSKADLLIQPRSFRMHLQTADNNIDPLHVSKLFSQAYDNQEVFSTINRDYDPMSPICMTDKAGVISRISMHKTGSYIYNGLDFTVEDKGTSTVIKDFNLVPAGMVDDFKANSINTYVVYPKEASGDFVFNSTTNVLSIESTYEFANHSKKYFKIYFGSSAPTYDTTNESLLTISSYADGLPITFDGSAPSSHKYQVKDCIILSTATKQYVYQGGPCVYKYSDLRNVYVVKVKNFLTEGLYDYFTDAIGAKYHSLIVNDSKPNHPVNINTVHSTMFFSLWSFILCAATPYIVRARINSFRDVLYYEKNVEYPFTSTLIPIKDVLSKAYTNFAYTDYDSELVCKEMTPATALTWILPEMFQQVGYDSTSGESSILMPWYTCQNAIKHTNEGGVDTYSWNDDASAMSFPSIRSGCRLASLDTLYGMTEKDVRLSLDMISSFKSLSPTLANCKTYKYSAVGDGQLVLSYDASTYGTRGTLLRLPRELGFFMTAPYGTLTPDYNHARSLNGSYIGNTCYRAYYWFGDNACSTGSGGTQTIISSLSINVNRAQNFKQKWYCVLASGTIPSVDHGFFLSAAHAFAAGGGLLSGRTSFNPYTGVQDNGSGVITSKTNKMRSFQKFLWTRIQKLPFIISPFDVLELDNTGSPNNVVLCDPWDLCYVFGLGGFRASDYRESVYNREKEVVNQGMLFVSDPWIEASPVFKEGSVSSGISVSKGFEL